MFAPKYVWIMPSWYSKGWWKEDYGNSSCTPDIMKKVLNSSLAITPSGYFVSDSLSTVSFSGMVSFNNTSHVQISAGIKKYILNMHIS